MTELQLIASDLRRLLTVIRFRHASAEDAFDAWMDRLEREPEGMAGVIRDLQRKYPIAPERTA